MEVIIFSENFKVLIMSPPPRPHEGDRDILVLVRILLASAWHFLFCTISHEPVGAF